MMSVLKHGGRCLEHAYLLLGLAQQAEKRGDKQKGDFFRRLSDQSKL
jgi:hypothetical protein